MTSNFNVGKMYNTVEWIGCLRVSLEIIMEPLKKRTIETNFFENKHTSAERTAQTMDDCKICLENKYSVA